MNRGNPTRNVFGWQKPCYLLSDEGYVDSFQEMMDSTPWDNYLPLKSLWLAKVATAIMQ
jgi:hypothetical protein